MHCDGGVQMTIAQCCQLVIALCWALAVVALCYQAGALIGTHLAYHPEHTPAALAERAWYIASGKRARDRAGFEEWASQPEVVQMARDMAAVVSKLGVAAEDIKRSLS